MGATKTKKIADNDLDQIITLKKKLLNLRFQKSSAQLVDTSQLKKTKKEIARLLTKINNKHNKCE